MTLTVFAFAASNTSQNVHTIVTDVMCVFGIMIIIAHGLTIASVNTISSGSMFLLSGF